MKVFKACNQPTKDRMFEEFLGHLNKTNLDVPEEYIDEMNELGIETDQYTIISDYLKTVQESGEKFVSLVRGFIQ